MEILQYGVERKRAIQEYIKYECLKKGLDYPDTAGWNWDKADDIDIELRAAHFKHGIIAGFLTWDVVALSLEDLRKCAVVKTIALELRQGSQTLGVLEKSKELSETVHR